MRHIRRQLLSALSLALVAGCSVEPLVIVDVRTNFVPAIEFDTVHVELDGERRVSRLPREGDDWFRGVRVGRVGISGATATLRASLHREGREVTARAVAVTGREGMSVITILLTRDCLGVVCPQAGAPEATACLGGVCVPETCVDGTQPSCPEARCADDAECLEADGCAIPTCLGGACTVRPGPCGADERVCDLRAGMCVAAPIVDAGSADAGGEGPDAGRTGTADAGLEDAGASVADGGDVGGADAGGEGPGTDGGFDAGGADAASGPGCSRCPPTPPLAPTAFYSNDFDGSLGGWVPVGPTSTRPGEAVVPGCENDWGGIQAEYWGGGPDDPDRLLSFFASSTGQTLRWRRDFVNTTGDIIRQLEVRYDLELAWFRMQGADSGASNFGVREFAIAWELDGVTFAGSTRLDNRAIAEVDRAVWLCDHEKDRLGVRRAQVHAATELAIMPGQTFQLSFALRTSGIPAHHINGGVDNLVVVVSP